MKNILGIIGFIALQLFCIVSPGQEAQPPKTNFLFIIVDDLRPQLGCYGNAETLSPNIDRLAEEGLLFRNAYCNVPVCGASRASLLTGTRPTASRFTNAATWAEKDVPDLVDIPGYLKQNGYKTISNGKIYHHQFDNAASWDDNYKPKDFRDYKTPENIELMKTKGMAAAWEIAPVPDDSLQGGKIANKVIADLRNLKKSGNPFFLTAGFTKPHLPFIAPEKYWDMYDHNKIELAKNPFAPEKCPKEALHNWGELRKQYTGIPQTGPVSDEVARNLIHGYNACVSFSDSMIGRILDELVQLELDKNTVVILCGDHGWQLGEHGLWCKHSNFNTSLQVPLIIRAPGFAKNAKVEALVEFVDLFPSICELAGIEIPKHLQGKSMKPLLENPDTEWKEAIFSRFKNGESVKTKYYLYTEYRIKGERISQMLYNHNTDKDENKNIADENESVTEKLHLLMKSEGILK
ncbi:sulfatase [uncultured Draconibacterium sp.]|uniref:sulfatase n=1 Tax=uncultured Draconibacterium sp. TaxID=1573823 RepID=UPI0029C988E5|nr:sulfatase [uncultured Draconibacterium sp.]